MKDTVKSENKLVVNKDVSWLWRTAYNCAVKGLGIWGDADVTSMFILAKKVSTLALGSCKLTLGGSIWMQAAVRLSSRWRQTSRSTESWQCSPQSVDNVHISALDDYSVLIVFTVFSARAEERSEQKVKGF